MRIILPFFDCYRCLQRFVNVSSLACNSISCELRLRSTTFCQPVGLLQGKNLTSSTTFDWHVREATMFLKRFWTFPKFPSVSKFIRCHLWANDNATLSFKFNSLPWLQFCPIRYSPSVLKGLGCSCLIQILVNISMIFQVKMSVRNLMVIRVSDFCIVIKLKNMFSREQCCLKWYVSIVLTYVPLFFLEVLPSLEFPLEEDSSRPHDGICQLFSF